MLGLLIHMMVPLKLCSGWLASDSGEVSWERHVVVDRHLSAVLPQQVVDLFLLSL